MIKALLLDLGDTLFDTVKKTLFPGVEDALRVLQTFETQDGKPLFTGLVSNYTMPEPRTAEAIATLFAEYLQILDEIGLRSFFAPAEQRVTLSTTVGVRKPDKAIFEAALARGGIAGSLADVLFITEEADHIAACRKLGMTALQFGLDFKAWSAAPLLIAQTIGVPKNSERAR